MDIWMIFVILAIIAVVIELFAPTMFCINFAIAGVITAVISLFYSNIGILLIIFAALSLFSILFIKPLFLKMLKRNTNADFASQYIGKVVKCIEPINKVSGAVTIYDERWEARLSDDSEEIPAGSDVKIVSNVSLMLYVEKV